MKIAIKESTTTILGRNMQRKMFFFFFFSFLMSCSFTPEVCMKVRGGNANNNCSVLAQLGFKPSFLGSIATRPGRLIKLTDGDPNPNPNAKVGLPFNLIYSITFIITVCCNQIGTFRKHFSWVYNLWTTRLEISEQIITFPRPEYGRVGVCRIKMRLLVQQL